MTGFVRCGIAAVALSAVSACGGSTIAPSNATPNVRYVGAIAMVNGRPVTAARPRFGALGRFAPILPSRPEKNQAKTYEYVINFYGTYASIFDYPKSTSQIGTINNVGGQGCTNKLYGYGKKTFWIVAGSDQITEYRVPQKPLKTLSVPASSMPSSCAMNAKGDLAVGILAGANTGDIVIFKKATGTGTWIPTPLAQEYFDGYDAKGNLFFDGFTKASQFGLFEIPRGTSTVKAIATSNAVEFPGSVQWDGKYMVVTDQLANAMYRYAISGTKATLKGTVTLSGSGDCAQTWIVTGLVYCGDASTDGGEVFNYPAGGSPAAVLQGSFATPLGVVAAKK